MEFVYKNKLTNADIEQIEAFFEYVDLCPIEQHPVWCEKIDRKNPVYFIAYEDSRITCYSTLYEKKIGPVGFANIRFGPLFIEPEHLVSSLEEIKKHYKKRGFSYISIQLAFPTGTITDIIEAKFYQATKFKNTFNRENWSSIVVNLNKDVEDIFKDFRAAHKSSIKKAVKANLIVRPVESINEIKELARVYHKMELFRKIDSHSVEEIENQFMQVHDFLSNRKKGFIVVVIDEAGLLIGGTINIFQGKSVRYYKGAADPEKRNVPVLHSAIFESIKIAKELNYEYFDLWGYNHYVGENDQLYNINLFKKGFGGEFIFYPKIMHIQLVPFGRFLYTTVKGLKEKMHKIFSR